MADQAGDTRESASDWRRELMFMRTRSVFRNSGSAAGAADLLAKLGPKNLNAAAQNPDHSVLGRKLAESALKTQGARLTQWRLRVPSFLTRADLDAGDSIFFGPARALRLWSGRAIFILLALLFVIVAIDEKTGGPAKRGPTGETGMLDVSVPPYAYVVTTAFGLAILIWLIATALRDKPARLLLLRKFNVRALNNALTRVIAHELRPYGHVVSLADKHIKRDRWSWLSTAALAPGNPLAAAWLIIGAPIRFVWRRFDRSSMGPAIVTRARDYRALARKLGDRLGLNMQTALTSKEAFLVQTNDAWWQMVVRLLSESADAIVVDVSQVAQGTAWELDLIKAESAAARCVFIARDENAAGAREALEQWGFPNPLFAYDVGGAMRDRNAFRAAMLSAMRVSLTQ